MHIESDKFALFAWNDFYPIGGWNDFVNDFASIAEAYDAALTYDKSFLGSNWHIVNLSTMKVVKSKYDF